LFKPPSLVCYCHCHCRPTPARVHSCHLPHPCNPLPSTTVVFFMRLNVSCKPRWWSFCVKTRNTLSVVKTTASVTRPRLGWQSFCMKMMSTPPVITIVTSMTWPRLCRSLCQFEISVGLGSGGYPRARAQTGQQMKLREPDATYHLAAATLRPTTCCHCLLGDRWMVR